MLASQTGKTSCWMVFLAHPLGSTTQGTPVLPGLGHRGTWLALSYQFLGFLLTRDVVHDRHTLCSYGQAS